MRLSLFNSVSILLVSSLTAGCASRQVVRPGHAPVRVLLFLDATRSCQARHTDFVRYAAQVAVTAPAGTVVEACTFGSDVRIAPFYEGLVRQPATFAQACRDALAKPSPGKGTFGAPLLRRVRERIARNRVPTLVVLLTDGGFDDLPELRREAARLAMTDHLLVLFALPVVSTGSAYTRLEDALEPLGDRARLAARADAPEALRTVRERCAEGARKGE
jgi:hypothetical protein